MQSQKHTNPKNKCKRKILYSQSMQPKFSRPLGGALSRNVWFLPKREKKNFFLGFCMFLTLHHSCICSVLAVNVLVLAFCSMFFICSTYRVFLNWFLKLQHVSPNRNVLGCCSTFAPVGHHSFLTAGCEVWGHEILLFPYVYNIV